MKMKNKLTYISGVVAICLLPGLLFSQQKSQKNHYTFEKIEMKTPWLLSGNGAGLVFNPAQSFANLGAYFTNEQGDYRNFDQPVSYSTFGLETKSYTKIKNVYFYGSFNYDYGINEDLAWRGTIYPRSNINPILDTVPGKVLREDYILSGKVGYNLSDKVSIGAAFDYQTSTAAKRIDGRNRNTLSKLGVAPGITFKTKPLILGLNLSYKRNVERLDYTFIGDITGKYIYYTEGLWFYTRTGITNTTILDRTYFQNYYGGGLQAQIKTGKLSLYNQFTVDYGNEDNFERNFARRYAFVENLIYKYDGIFTYSSANIDHIVSLRFVSDENLSYNVVNNYELIPGEANNWAFFEYGKTLRYATGYQNYGAEYKVFVRDGEWKCKWILAAGFNQHRMDKEYKVYPAVYKQDYTVNELYLRINRDLAISANSTINLDLNGGYVTGSGTKLKETNPLTTGSLKLNQYMLDTDFAYNIAERVIGGLGAKYTRVTNSQKGTSVYLGAAYKYLNATDYRGFLSVTLGLNF